MMNELRLEGNDGGGVSWSLLEHGGMMDQEEGTGNGEEEMAQGKVIYAPYNAHENGHQIA